MPSGLENIIRTELAQSASKEDIYLRLLTQGVKVDEIAEAYAEATSSESTGKNPLQQKVISIVLTIAAVFVGAGVFSFIASNWQGMSDASKVLTIIVCMLSAYFLAWLADTKIHYDKTATALYLLGNAIYGGGIFLIAQIFNIKTNWPDGFVYWAVGVLLFSFASKRKSFLVVAAFLFIIAAAYYPIMFTTAVGLRTIAPISTVVILLTTCVLLYTAHTLRLQANTKPLAEEES